MPAALESLAEQFARQSQRVLSTFQATNHTETGYCCAKSHAPTRANCVINLHDHWSQFCRSLLIKSAIGGWSTRAGATLAKASALPPGNDVTGFLRTASGRRPPFWEPNWTVASDFISACRLVGIGNLSDVSAAIGSTSSHAEELRLTRNYLAHRNAATATRAVRALAPYGATLPLDIATFVNTPARAGTQLFEIWVDGLTSVAFTAC